MYRQCLRSPSQTQSDNRFKWKEKSPATCLDETYLLRQMISADVDGSALLGLPVRPLPSPFAFALPFAASSACALPFFFLAMRSCSASRPTAFECGGLNASPCQN